MSELQRRDFLTRTAVRCAGTWSGFKPSAQSHAPIASSKRPSLARTSASALCSSSFPGSSAIA